MEITTSAAPGAVPATILHVSGDIDASTEAQLVESAREAVARGAHRLIVDLSAVRYLSSAGVRALHKVYLLLRPGEDEATVLAGLRDGSYTSPHLKLLKPNADVRAVLTTTGLDMYLQIHPDLESALASLTGH